jgi:hypothetical protein
MGASAYVIKADAGRKLLRAVEAALQRKPFTSGRLASNDFGDSADTGCNVRSTVNNG